MEGSSSLPKAAHLIEGRREFYSHLANLGAKTGVQSGNKSPQFHK